jgi:acyl-CoA dehydrogenase
MIEAHPPAPVRRGSPPVPTRLTGQYPYLFAEHHVEVEARAAAFAAEAPSREGWDIRARVAALGAAGLLDVGIARNDVRAIALVRRQLAYADAMDDLAFIIQELGGFPLSQAPERAGLLAEARAGRRALCFALTEPEAGSDVRGVATQAVKHGDTWWLTGTKWYVSNACDAHTAVVFARHSDGVGCFVVHDPPSSPQRVAGHSIGRIELDDTPGELVAARGFPLALGALERCRPTVGAAAIGLAARAFDETVRHVSVRQQFGAPLAALPVVRDRVAQMALDLEQGTLATLHACWRRDTAAPEARTSYESAVGKVAATEAAQRVLDAAVQLHGARGVDEDSLVQRLWREARPLTIYEGATDVLHTVIAARHLGDA